MVNKAIDDDDWWTRTTVSDLDIRTWFCCREHDYPKIDRENVSCIVSTKPITMDVIAEDLHPVRDGERFIIRDPDGNTSIETCRASRKA